MKNKNLKKFALNFVNSFILLPVFATSMPTTDGFNQVVSKDNSREPAVVLSQKLNLAADNLVAFGNSSNNAPSIEDQTLEDQANAIDAYFRKYGMPLQGMGLKMAMEARDHDMDWRLIPAIAVRESTGGKFACKKATFNPFGWGSCKIGFDSYEKAIEILAKNLAGKNPKTEHYYSGKTTKEILQKYNPPSIVPKYAEQVMAIMDAIGPAEVVLAIAK